MRISDEEMRAAVDRMTLLAIRAALSPAQGADRSAAPLVIVNPAAPRTAPSGRMAESLRRARLAALGLDARDRAHRAAGPRDRAGARGAARRPASWSSRSAATARSTRSSTASSRRHGDRARRPSCAIVPIGTGPRRVRTYGISSKPERAIALIADGRDPHDRPRPGDVHARTAAARSRGIFLNIASCGLSGAVAERANRTRKRLGGTPAFLWATVATFAGWRNVPFRVTIDGERARAGRQQHDRRQRAATSAAA